MNSVKNSNKNNALHAILFEAVSLTLHLDMDRELMVQSVALLGKFLMINEPNIKYLALENMSRLALIPEMLEAINRHQKTIISSLKVRSTSMTRELNWRSSGFPLCVLAGAYKSCRPMNFSTTVAHQSCPVS